MSRLSRRTGVLRLIDVRKHMPGYQEYRGDERTDDIAGIIVHHSGTADKHTGKPVGDSQAFFSYHIDTQGRRTGGYHYVILANGQIEYALDESIPAPHAPKVTLDNPANEASPEYQGYPYISVCLVGWFENGRTYEDVFEKTWKTPNLHTQPPQAQMRSLLKLLVDICTRYGFSASNVMGHRELKNIVYTCCPGDNIDLDLLREKLADALQNTPPPQRRFVAKRPRFLIPHLRERLTRVFNMLLRLLYRSMILIVGGAVIWAAFHPLRGISILIYLVAVLMFLPAIPVLRLIWRNPKFSTPIRRLLRQEPALTMTRIWVPYQHLPSHLAASVLTSEDKEFFRHAGFSWIEIWRAFRASRLGARRRGASTITQQVVKNLFLWPETTYSRKILESILTVYMEALLSKRRILELYVNFAQFGPRIFGVEAASRIWLDKTASELTPKDAVLITTLLPNPIELRPDKPTPRLLEKREQLLRQTTNNQQWLNRRIKLHPDTPQPIPYQAVGAVPAGLEALLAYHQISAQVFWPYHILYFERLSSLLRDSGMLSGSSSVDRFSFSESIKRFQVKRGLPVSGIPDEDTLWALQYPTAVKKNLRLKTFEPEGSQFYPAYPLRSDVAKRFHLLCREITECGGEIITARESQTSNQGEQIENEMGLIFELDAKSGMHDCQTDPFIITRAGGYWRVWVRAAHGLERDLQAAIRDGEKLTTAPVHTHVLDFTALAKKYGFCPTGMIKNAPNGGEDSRWWRFRCEAVLTPWISQMGIEALSLGHISQSDLEANQSAWKYRKAVYKSQRNEITWP